MNLPKKQIIKFIKKHHVLTLATSVDNKPYCANCFYVYLEDRNAFVFTSDVETKHIQDVLQNNYVAGSVVLETNVIGKIQGIQFNGFLHEPKDQLLVEVKKSYLKRFPIAQLMQTTLWVLDLTFIKLTDNKLGFGKKLIWNDDESFLQ